jgi:hypothetical protein
MIENSIKQFRAKRNSSRNRTGAGEATKQRLGLAQRDIARSENETSRSLQRAGEAQEAQYNPSDNINSWMGNIDDLRAERASREQSTTGAGVDMSAINGQRPEPRYETEFRGSATPPAELRANEEFTSAIESLATKYSISTDELYSVIQGESAFDMLAQNPSGATGLFQFMPTTAEELGTSTDAILGMSAVEQVGLYDKYLERWNYTGENRLGIMQAAPAYASRSPEAVIYAKDTAAWRQNPGWRSLGGGDITVQSINSYYAKQDNT